MVVVVGRDDDEPDSMKGSKERERKRERDKEGRDYM